MDKLLKLNLGCGLDIKAGHVNVDIHSYATPGVIIWDMTDYLVSLPDASVSKVVMRDCLDCLPHGWVKKDGGAVVHTDVHPTVLEVLHQVKRVLVPGGTAYIRVLDVEYVISKWLESKEDEQQDSLKAFQQLTHVLLGELGGSLYDGRHSLWNVDELTRVLDIVYFEGYSIEHSPPNTEVRIVR